MGRSTALSVRDSLTQLSRPGPHQVRRGDLRLIGLPGVVYTPASGWSLPAIAFGHGFLQPCSRYLGLLRHLASWGFVAAAPDTNRGPLPSMHELGGDLLTALDVCSGVRLGDGLLSVDPDRLGLVGHGIGGGAAVLAAARAPERVRSVTTWAVAQLMPSVEAAARDCSMPAMHIAAGRDRLAPLEAHAEPIALAWAGPMRSRLMTKASHLGFTEGAHWSTPLLDGRPERRTRQLSHALTTAFLLRTLTDDHTYDELLDSDVSGCPITHPG